MFSIKGHILMKKTAHLLQEQLDSLLHIFVRDSIPEITLNIKTTNTNIRNIKV